MSGTGDQQPRSGNPLNHLKDEVLGTLRLLFKQVAQYPVEMSLQVNVTTYLTDIPTTITNVPLEKPVIRTSDDPIRVLSQGEIPVCTLNLITDATLAPDTPCTFEPVASHEPVFDDMDFVASGVSFDNLTLENSAAWPTEPIVSKLVRQPVEQPAKPTVSNIPAGRFKGQSYSFSDLLPKIRTMNTPRFYALPIKKSPIPPHRFPAELRAKFREALAEKAQTHAANVQLRIVFERMDMSLFSGIQQDEHGNLLCTPRNELLGRNRELVKKAQKPTPAGHEAYLVYGFRLDNKQDIRALVPVTDREANA